MSNGDKSAQSDTPTVYIKSKHDDGPTFVDAGGEEDISLMENPLNIQLQCQMGISQLNQIPLLSVSNKSMMMVQPQASLCQNSTLMILCEGPF